MQLRLASLVLVLGACSSDSIDSNEQARRAYLGLDASVGKSIQLGFDGFNSASSANIPAETATGVVAGTLTVVGQVDQGASDNKGMRLSVGMVAYTDGDVVVDDHGDSIHVIYDTDVDPTTQPALSMMLKGIPTGTIDGTLIGTYHLSGDLEGDVILNLTFSGDLAAGPNNTVVRAPGTTNVMGTAQQGDGTYDVTVQL